MSDVLELKKIIGGSPSNVIQTKKSFTYLIQRAQVVGKCNTYKLKLTFVTQPKLKLKGMHTKLSWAIYDLKFVESFGATV